MFGKSSHNSHDVKQDVLLEDKASERHSGLKNAFSLISLLANNKGLVSEALDWLNGTKDYVDKGMNIFERIKLARQHSIVEALLGKGKGNHVESRFKHIVPIESELPKSTLSSHFDCVVIEGVKNVADLKSRKHLLGEAKFAFFEGQVSRNYETHLILPNYLGNKHLTMRIYAHVKENVVGSESEQYLVFSAHIVKEGQAIFQISKNIQINHHRFNQSEENNEQVSVGKNIINLPNNIKHSIRMKETGEMILHFDIE